MTNKRRLKIGQIIKARDISMAKLSRMADLPLNTVRRLVKEPEYSPNVQTLWNVADALHLTLNDLYEEIDDEGEA